MKVGEKPPPPWALEMERGATSVGFRWQRSVTGGEWSGRLEGLEICRVADVGTGFSFGVGKPGKLDEDTGGRNVSKAHERFAEILRGHAGRFGALE